MSDAFTWLAPDEAGYIDCHRGPVFVGYVIKRRYAWSAWARDFDLGANYKIGDFFTKIEAKSAVEQAAIKALGGTDE